MNLSAIKRSLRSLKSAKNEGASPEQKVTSAERTHKYHERLKNDNSKFRKLKVIKYEQNRQYKEHIRQERKNNPALNEKLKAQQREWKKQTNSQTHSCESSKTKC